MLEQTIFGCTLQVVGEDDKYIYVTLQILPVPSAADYPDPQSPDDVLQDLRSFTTSDDCFPFTIQLPSSGEKVRPCWVRVDPVCPTTSGEFLHILYSNTVNKATPWVQKRFLYSAMSL